MVTDRPSQAQNWRNPERPTIPQLLFSYPETAQMIGCSVRQVFTLRKKGELPATLVGGLVKFHIDVIRGYVQSHTEGSN